jgi:hypothetical protein
VDFRVGRKGKRDAVHIVRGGAWTGVLAALHGEATRSMSTNSRCLPCNCARFEPIDQGWHMGRAISLMCAHGTRNVKRAQRGVDGRGVARLLSTGLR